MMTILHSAAETGDLETVRRLVEEGGDCSALYWQNQTLLHCAVENGHLDVVRFFVDEKGLDFKARDNGGITPLHTAAAKGRMEIIKYLVNEKGANVTTVDDFGRTIVHYAVKNGHLDVVKYFVDEKGLDFEARDNGGVTPLHTAAAKGRMKIIKYLVNEKGANVTTVDDIERTPVHYAVKNWRLGVVRFLLYFVHKKRIDLKTLSELQYDLPERANGKGDLEMILNLICKTGVILEDKRLISLMTKAVRTNDLPRWSMCRYFDPVAFSSATRHDDGTTFLSRAASNGCLEVFKYFFDFLLKCYVSRITRNMCHWNILQSFNAVQTVLRKLFDWIRDELRWRNIYGVTLLHITAQEGHLELVKYLVEMGADIVARDVKGRTPVYYAAKAEQLDVVRYFLDEKNAESLDRYSLINSLLRSAIEGWSGKMIKYLESEKGASLERTSVSGDWKWETVELRYQQWQNNEFE